MTAAAPDILVHRGIDRSLIGMILASAVLHGGVVALFLAMPDRFLSGPPKMESYTVDLVAPDVVGGTNLLAGGGKAKASASKPGPPAVPEPPPAAELPPAKPMAAPPPPAPPPEAAKPPAPEPVKPAPAPPKVVEVPKPPEAKPAQPPKPAPVAEAKPPEPKPVAKAPAPPKPVAKPAEPAPAPGKAQAEPAKKPAEPPKAPGAPAKSRDEQIAAAVQRRAAQVQSGSGGARQDLDQQIAAAVQRRAQQVGAGGDSGPAGPGGPVSIGPGSGTGGTPAGIEYILYQGKMEERIKAAWAWAGADKSRHSVVQFNLSPSGEIKNVRTIESSGDTQYDASCERAVRAVNPLDPVPEKYRKDFATVEMTFKPSDLEH